ncbi:type II toxin-antitoxin system RelE/ParE family toxin [Salmonella enterica]|nr:type II toxin-antitoxin system RelE/ParE family toxin [Salmonella enterica]ELF7042859.1 type II toxin-antitoxin system RelE/ParE family toxin [Salmonella enterica]
MRVVKLTPKAEDDLEAIWHYGRQHFGEAQADKYTDNLSAIFQLLGDNHIGTHRPELGEDIYALPFERHMIYFLQTQETVIVIRVLSQYQDAGRHLYWQ